ncbi:MAG: trypsin-like peptidase domain-containing protein [Dehalococcoidales bacterium]
MKDQIIIIKSNYRWFLGLMLSILLLFLVASSLIPSKFGLKADTATRIIGYVGTPGTNYEYVEWNKLTEAVIGTIAVTSSTDPTIIDTSGTHFTALTNINNEARTVNPSIKVLAQISGGNWQNWDDGHLTAIMGNSTYRNQLATNLANFVSTYNLDGIDIDWEGTDITEANYHAFLISLRADFPSRAIISVDAPAAIDDQPATDCKYWFDPTMDSQYVNWYDIMSYGLSYSDFTAYADQWIKAGFPVGQLNWGYDATENAQADNINLLPEKVEWTLAQGAGGEMIWKADRDVDGNSQLFLDTIYNVIYPQVISTDFATGETTLPAGVVQVLTSTSPPIITSANPSAYVTPEQVLTISVPSSVSDLETLLESIYTKVSPSVVLVNVAIPASGFTAATKVLGSGFVWDTQGDIVTNNHVISGASSITVTFSDGTVVDASLVGADEDSDLAVIKVNPNGLNLQPVTLSDSTKVQVGQLALAIGNPYGLENTLIVGFVSAIGRVMPANEIGTGPLYGISDIIQLDAAINPGNTGGVILNDTGALTGIIESIKSKSGSSNGITFAIPSTIIKQVIPSLIASDK